MAFEAPKPYYGQHIYPSSLWSTPACSMDLLGWEEHPLVIFAKDMWKEIFYVGTN